MPKRKPSDLPINDKAQADELKRLREDLRIAEQKIHALTKSDNRYHIKGGSKDAYKFAVLSDTHVGSLWCNEDAIVEFYRYAFSRGCRDFLNAGDLLEGDSMFRGQVYELKEVGFERQLNALREIAEKLPRKAKTHFITGNHDASFAKQIGFNVGAQIEATCRNFRNVGADSGIICVDTPGGELRIGLLHPDGGSAYALSYRMQKIIEAWEGGAKPHLFVLGHFHKAEFMPRYRNVSGIQAGCFQKQTSFMARKALAAHVGGWIVEMEIGELYNRIKTEFVSFF